MPAPETCPQAGQESAHPHNAKNASSRRMASASTIIPQAASRQRTRRLVSSKYLSLVVAPVGAPRPGMYTVLPGHPGLRFRDAV
jgi:hypothetical protein